MRMKYFRRLKNLEARQEQNDGVPDVIYLVGVDRKENGELVEVNRFPIHVPKLRDRKQK